jgi:S-DNA-T family DNA segregation ATPase FtsK/SpoIIIE
VRLWEIIETKRFWEHSSNLVFAVGRDIAGKVVIADIAKMSHVLIGGTTGSGKSVCMDSIIVSVLYKAQPNHVKMIMIDLKEVNLNVYNGIPHLLIPVITNSQKALSVLYWTVEEMFERYKKFADFGDHDLKEYNHKIELLSLKDNSNNLKKIPQILIIINDLSDLMRINPKETEESIVRLA